MAKATGTLTISEAGGSFDSATYPRFVLGDGTNSLTFVIDNTARGLLLDDESTAATSYSSTGDFPLEDPMKGNILIPTIDEADGAQKSILGLWLHDATSVNTLAAAIASESVLDGSDNLIAVTSRLHFEVTDSDGNTIRIGLGGSTQAKKSTVEGHMQGNAYRHQAQNGTGQTWYSAYQESTTSTNYLVHVTTTGGGDDYAEYRLPVALYGAFKAAYEDDNINIDAYELCKEASGDGLRQSSLGSNQYGSGADTYTRGVLLQYKTAGTKGNACRIVLKDPNGVLDSNAKQRGISYGYEEYTNATMRAAYGNRDDNLGTNNNFPGESLNTEIYFRGGTVAGSGSDSALSTAQIAEAIKEIVNGSKLNITATRSGSEVSLENDSHGVSGNVTITTTNAGSLFSVSGMSGGSAASGGNAVAKRITISARQLALSGSGGLSGSSGGKSSLMLHLAGLSAAAIAQTDVLAFADVGSSNVPKKITFSDLEDTVFGNVSGDATVAAGGALTIAADAVESGMLNDNVISGQSALGSAAAAQGDEMLFSDGGTLKKITFSNLEDSIFGNVSGDATIAAGGALTIAATSVEGSMLNNNVISGLDDINAALATTDEIMVSDAGTIKRMDLSRLSTMMAGAGLADTSGTLVLNIDGLDALSDVGNVHQTNDHFLISDGGTEKKITFSDLEDEIFGNVSGDIAVAAGGAATIQADAVESGMLNDNVISGQTALGSAAAAQADEMLFSDGGTLKKITFSNLEDSIFGNVSGDATVAAGGAMTMAAAQTNITSLLATDIKIGEDDQTKIDFATTNQIAFYANNNQEMTITDDGVTIAGNLTVNGTTTTIDTTHLLVEDSLIEIARGDGTAGTRASNASAGFYISGSVRSRDVSLTVAADGGRLRVSGSKDVGSGFDIDAAGDYAIAGTQVLSSDGAVKVQSGVAGAGLGHSSGVLSLDIDELSALGGTGVAQGDHFVFSDGGTEKKITASNLEDWMFGNVSGDATIAAGGALTIAADAVEGSMLNDNVISGQTELAQGSLAAADEIMISDGGTLKKFGADSLAKDMLALTTEAAVADGDYIMFLDGGSTGETKKEALADLATLFAGDGLTAASSVLAVQVSGAVKITSDKVGLTGSLAGSGLTFTGGANSIATLAVDIDDLDALGGAGLHQTQDHFMFSDNGTEKKITFSNLQDAVFADVSGDATVAAGGALTIAADAVESGMLNDNVISGQSALGSAAAAQADEMLFSDGGTLKKITFSNLEDSIFGNVSGDATIAAGGALTIASTAVEGSMLNNNVISGQTDIGGALATTDELLVSDNGTIRRTDLSRLSTMMAGAGLQDSSGTLTLSTREDRFTGSAVALSGNVGSLNQTPATTASVFVFINGMAQSQNYDYTISGTTLALKGANTLATDDEVIVKYVVQ